MRMSPLRVAVESLCTVGGLARSSSGENSTRSREAPNIGMPFLDPRSRILVDAVPLDSSCGPIPLIMRSRDSYLWEYRRLDPPSNQRLVHDTRGALSSTREELDPWVHKELDPRYVRSSNRGTQGARLAVRISLNYGSHELDPWYL